MNSERDAIRVTIRSRRVPVGIGILSIPYSTPIGLIITTKRVVLYDYLLDGEHEEVLREARELAARTGSRLVVSDLSREGLARRLLRRLADRISVHGALRRGEDVIRPRKPTVLTQMKWTSNRLRMSSVPERQCRPTTALTL
jgi:hypothetical protein